MELWKAGEVVEALHFLRSDLAHLREMIQIAASSCDVNSSGKILSRKSRSSSSHNKGSTTSNDRLNGSGAMNKDESNGTTHNGGAPGLYGIGGSGAGSAGGGGQGIELETGAIIGTRNRRTKQQHLIAAQICLDEACSVLAYKRLDMVPRRAQAMFHPSRRPLTADLVNARCVELILCTLFMTYRYYL